jgi:hypothetical protein
MVCFQRDEARRNSAGVQLIRTQVECEHEASFFGQVFGLRLIAGYGITQRAEGRPVNDVLKQAV